VRAPRDPAWVADGFVSERWMRASPVTGQIDAVGWRVPMERLGQVIEGEEALKALPAVEARPVAPESLAEMPAPTLEAVRAETVDANEVATTETAGGAAPSPGKEASAGAQPAQSPADGSGAPGKGDGSPRPDEAENVRPPLPDDPGVEPSEDGSEKAANRFRLF